MLTPVASFDDIRDAIRVFNDSSFDIALGLDLLVDTRYWVQDPVSGDFGPGKFCGFKGLSAEQYQQERNREPQDSRFNGAKTRESIQDVAGKFAANETLKREFVEWAEAKFGRDQVAGISRDKWRFLKLPGMAPGAPWGLKPGVVIRRVDLHERYGGSRQGGISPSRSTPNVLLFSDPKSGARHGYTDGWQADGFFHYTGEGQRGDQEVRGGNLAILGAHEKHRAIRLFRGSGGNVEYIDEFLTDKQRPYYTTDAPETGGGPIRSVIVFRLRPVTITPPVVEPSVRLPATALVERVPVEANNVERMYVEPAREEYEAERRESGLVQKLKSYLEAKGRTVQRLRIQPPGEAKPLFCDLYASDLDLLVEAKGSVDRQSIRMAIGQLIDYRRFTRGNTRCAVLLPSRPRDDLRALVESAGFELIYPTGDTLEWLSPNDRVVPNTAPSGNSID
jgi:hypothetical protein